MTGTQSAHYQCLQDAFARIKALGLPGFGLTPPALPSPPVTAPLTVPAPNVYAYRLPVDALDFVTLPAVVVSFGGAETLLDGDFEDQQFGYPVLASILYATNRDLTVPVPDEPVLVWRRLIRDAFLDLPAPGVGAAIAAGGSPNSEDVWQTLIEFGPVIDPDYYAKGNVWLSQLTIRYFATETRGRP